MSIGQAQRSSEELEPPTSLRRRWRFPLLCILLLLSIGCNVLLILTAPPPDSVIVPFVPLWLLGFLPYLAACILVLVTKPPEGRGRKLELGLILAGAFVLRIMLLPILPDLSHDSWRYLWDARVTLHGYSPYAYAPGSPIFASLQDFIYANSRFRNVPTVYPPGAEAVYLLSYLIAPSNLFVLKGIFVLLDMLTCGALIYLLRFKGLDPARAIIYAWCPLPIVEFAIQGHLDAMTITFTMLAVVCSLSKRRGGRVWTGFWIAMAALTKFYPLFLLLVLTRRRDRALLITCFATIVLAYVPYLILGHGQVLGFFGTYFSEDTPNAGVVQHVMRWLTGSVGLNKTATLIAQYLVELLIAGVASLVVLVQRLRGRISMETSILLLLGVIFAISSHIFAWYIAVLLPWIALLVGPLWRSRSGLSSKGIAVAIAWYFSCIVVVQYFFNSQLNWNLYFLIAYDTVLVGLGIAAIVGLLQWRKEHHTGISVVK